jgi:DNA adenine methylase
MQQLPLFDTRNDLPPPAKVRPVLKWAGGKTDMIKHLAPGIWCKLQATRGRYIEPFLGGGALAFHLGLPGMLLNDAIDDLMVLYRTLAKQPGAVAWALSAYAVQGVDEDTYYRVRDARPTSAAQRAARFIYLNKTNFNGLYRENRRGEYNVPYGSARYRPSSVERKARDAMGGLFPNKEMLHKVGIVCAQSELLCGDFAPCVDRAWEGDVIYADPPYDAGFQAYTASGFDEDDQRRLAASLRAAAERGAHVLASNNDTPLIREIYDWAEIIVTKEARSINANGKGRARVGCVLITTDRAMVGT